MGDDRDEPVIAYSVKDLLTEMKKEITGKLDRLFDLLDGKADRADLLALQQTVSQHETRLTAVESEQERQQKHVQWRTEWRRWLIPTIISALLIVVTLLVYLIPPGGSPGK